MSTYQWVLIAHGSWRWVVLITGAAAILSAVRGLSRDIPWKPRAKRFGSLFGIAVDVQVLMGLVLYFALSPLTTTVLNAPGTLRPGSEQQFFAVSHAAVMLGAFFAVHIAAVLIRRGRTDALRHRRAVILYGLTMLLLLGGTPWWRPLLRI